MEHGQSKTKKLAFNMGNSFMLWSLSSEYLPYMIFRLQCKQSRNDFLDNSHFDGSSFISLVSFCFQQFFFFSRKKMHQLHLKAKTNVLKIATNNIKQKKGGSMLIQRLQKIIRLHPHPSLFLPLLFFSKISVDLSSLSLALYHFQAEINGYSCYSLCLYDTCTLKVKFCRRLKACIVVSWSTS